MSKLTHFNTEGAAHMVNIGDKAITRRRAGASGMITMKPETLSLIKEKTNKKGDVLAIARTAGIIASKKTSDLIPLCPPLSLTHINIELDINDKKNTIYCECCAETEGKTGVEMEALTSVQITLLTIYDMCKAVDKEMTITEIKLLEKTGGKSGDWSRI